MGAVFKREFRSFFLTPIGYVVMAIVFGISGWFFYIYNLYSGSASLSGIYSNILFFAIMVLIVSPLLTMRSFSEEKRQRTDQALLTAPVRLTGIVLGKFFAALLLFALALSITFVYAIVIATQVSPDWMVVIGNYVGMLLLAGMVIAAGLLFSSLTESQLVAMLLTSVFSAVLLMLDSLSSLFSTYQWLVDVIGFLSVYGRYTTFTQGIINYDNVFFFLSMQALFLFLTVRVLDSKRWG